MGLSWDWWLLSQLYPNRGCSKLLPFISKKTSTLLLFSIIIWFYVQYHVTNQAPSNTNNSDANKFDANKHLKQQIRDHLKQTRSESALDALGNAAGNFYHKHVKRASKDGYAPAADRLPKDCEHENWQTLSFPNCNDVHDLDLKEVLNLQREFVRLKRKAKKEGKSRELPSRREQALYSARARRCRSSKGL